MSANNLTINYPAIPTETLRFMLSKRHLNQTGLRRVLIIRPHSSSCAVLQWRTRRWTHYFKPWHMLPSKVCSAFMIKPRTGLQGSVGNSIRAFPVSAVSFLKYSAERISRQTQLNCFKRILVIQSNELLLRIFFGFFPPSPEICQNSKRTCRSIVLLIKCFVW